MRPLCFQWSSLTENVTKNPSLIFISGSGSVLFNEMLKK